MTLFLSSWPSGNTFEHESQRYQALQVLEMNRKLCNFRQRRLETLSEYLERLKNMVDQVNENNGTIGFSPAMVDSELTDQDPPLDTDTAPIQKYEHVVNIAKKKRSALRSLYSQDQGSIITHR